MNALELQGPTGPQFLFLQRFGGHRTYVQTDILNLKGGHQMDRLNSEGGGGEHQTQAKIRTDGQTNGMQLYIFRLFLRIDGVSG